MMSVIKTINNAMSEMVDELKILDDKICLANWTEGQKKFWSMVFDRLLIGSLILGLGFFFNLKLTEKSANEVFLREIVKVRVDKISHIWSLLYELEHIREEIFRIITNSDRTKAEELSSRLASLQQEYNEKSDETMLCYKRNKFWLGDILVSDLGNYLKLQYEFANAVLQWQKAYGDISKQKTFASKIDSLKDHIIETQMDITKVVEKVN